MYEALKTYQKRIFLSKKTIKNHSTGGRNWNCTFYPDTNIDIFIDKKEIIMVKYEPNGNTYKVMYLIRKFEKDIIKNSLQNLGTKKKILMKI